MSNRKEIMYKGYLIDLDGTAYLGEEVIEATVDFVKRCKEKNIKVLFLTNNASKTQKEIYEKLIDFGYDVEINEIYTSAIAISSYLKEHGITESIYTIGDKGLKEALNNQNIRYVDKLDYENKVDYEKLFHLTSVVVGYTKNLEYKDLGCASIILQKENAKLFGTNEDLILPTSYGNIPSNGAFIKLLENVSDKKALVVGKPSSIIMEEALKKMNLQKNEVCMIGDNYKTDILSGIDNQVDTIFVETGVYKIEEIEKFDKQPTYKVKDLSEIKI